MLHVFRYDRRFFEFGPAPAREPTYRTASLYITILPLALLLLLFLFKVGWFVWVLFAVAMLVLAGSARFAPQLFSDSDQA